MVLFSFFNQYSFYDTFVYKERIKAEQKSLLLFMELCLVIEYQSYCMRMQRKTIALNPGLLVSM